MPDTDTASDPLIIAGRAFTSRLIVGTGKYATYAQNAEAAEAAGAEIVTVALRRVNVADKGSDRLIDHLDPKKFTYLPNTAGCFTGEDAVRTLRLAREAGGWSLVKLEVLSNTAHLYPDMIETLRATEMLVKDGFDVMVYCTDDVVFAKRLEEAGADRTAFHPGQPEVFGERPRHVGVHRDARHQAAAKAVRLRHRVFVDLVVRMRCGVVRTHGVFGK